jgi:pimeloyl-ACP methyl ester carboxylesterase
MPHSHIKQDQVRGMLCCKTECFLATVGQNDAIAATLKVSLHHFPIHPIIIYHHYSIGHDCSLKNHVVLCCIVAQKELDPMPAPVYHFGGALDAPILHMALANGFAPLTYQPLLTPLLPHFHTVCLPPRALWPDAPPPVSTHTWRDIATDLLDGWAAQRWERLIAVGHSFGGIASMLAALQQPQRLRALILLDPTILPPPILRAVQVARFFRVSARHPLTTQALNRRTNFATHDEAFTYFRGKRLFHDWSDEALWLYVRGGLAAKPDGTWTLAWPSVWEAHYFQTIYANSWADLPKLARLTLPILIIRGGTSETLTAESAARVRRLVPNADYAEVAGHGHLFPQSAPAETSKIIQTWLVERGLHSVGRA